MNRTHIVHNHSSRTDTIHFGDKSVTVPWWFIGDGYSGVPDPKDSRPARVHDWCYAEQRWDDGSKMLRAEADLMLYMLMIQSADHNTSRVATIYWIGVRTFGWLWWHDRTPPTHLPLFV